ncbi:MAG TPA: deoxynucleoside kinase [bacterium]
MGAQRQTHFIAVAGSIGAGKSSLIRFLQERFGMHPFYEKNDDNPFLDDFYRDMPAYAFPAQVWFLARKFRAHREIGHLDRPAVLDRTIHEDAEVFAAHLAERGLFPRREYETYLALYRTIRDALPPPDLLIYLKSSVRTQRRRIALRGRPSERGLDPAYLRGLNRLYRGWIGRWRLSPVLVLDADRLDFVADLAHQADVLTTLRRHLSES